MQFLRTVFVAALVLLASAEASAQEPTPQQYEAVMQWAAGHQRIIEAVVAPLQQMPPPFAEDAQVSRLAWVSLARTWSTRFRATLQSAREAHSQLGPVPEAGAISLPYRRQAQALPTLFVAFESFLGQFELGVAAIERDDPDAMLVAAVNVIDAQILVMTQFRDLNALQAETGSDGPQRYLLRSFAGSYEALIAVLRVRRAAFLGGDIDAGSIEMVRAAAEAMRLNGRQGRAAAVQAEAMLPAQAPPGQGDFLRRIRLAYQSYGGSFDREDAIAGVLDSIADLLASGRAFADIEAELDGRAIRVGELDFERMADIQRRTALVQNVLPPT